MTGNPTRRGRKRRPARFDIRVAGCAILHSSLRRGGGNGRHAVLRGPWAFARVGSSPALGTIQCSRLRLRHGYDCSQIYGPNGKARQQGQLRGDVAKWTKAEVCKTSIRRFESARRLQFQCQLICLSSPAGGHAYRQPTPYCVTRLSAPQTRATHRMTPRCAFIFNPIGQSESVPLPGWRNGRRGGLKIRYPLTGVGVRVPLSALTTAPGVAPATGVGFA